MLELFFHDNIIIERDGLEFKRKVCLTLKPDDGYPFMYDKKFRPLLNPPPAGQTKGSRKNEVRN